MLDSLGITVVTIPLPFRLNHVNCFLAEGENGWIVIDSGLNNETTRKIWSEAIGEKEVSRLLITHYHPDHYGYAGGLQEKTGASLSMTEIDDRAGRNAWKDEFIQQIRNYYTIAGIPDQLADEMERNTADFIPRITPYPRVDHHLQEGEKIAIGRYEYEIIFTPGHSDGLVCFYNRDKNVLFSTDHILPKITPNISYWFHGDKNPLKTYQHSLNKIKRLHADFVIPSHGRPFYGANERIDEILTHHEERLGETLDAIGTGSTVYDVCCRLFRKDLTVHEQRFALGETLAHLEYLRYEKECKREKREGTWYYTV